MAVGIMECIDDLDAVSAVMPAVTALPQQQRSALLHILDDYVNVVLRIRASYIDVQLVDERLEQVAAEVGLAANAAMRVVGAGTFQLGSRSTS